MFDSLLTARTGKKPQIIEQANKQKPYWVEMIQDLVEGAGFSYSRIAYRIRVSPSTIQKLATRWDRKPRQPVFHRLLCLYQKIFKGPNGSDQMRSYLVNKKVGGGVE